MKTTQEELLKHLKKMRLRSNLKKLANFQFTPACCEGCSYSEPYPDNDTFLFRLCKNEKINDVVCCENYCNYYEKRK